MKLENLTPDKSKVAFDMTCDLEKTPQQKDKLKGAHIPQETEESDCAFGTCKTHQKAATCNSPQKLSQSLFEKFCVQHGIDPLTANKSSLVRVGEKYLRYVNQYRSLLGGRKISRVRGREAVLDYISMR